MRCCQALGVLLVERRRQPVHRRRAVEVVREIVLARPDHLDRRPRGARQRHRIEHEIDLETPPEAAAQVRGVHRHPLARDAQQLGGSVAGARLALRRRPDFAASVPHMGGGVHRLKTGVGQKRQAIGGFKGFAGGFQSGIDIPVPARRTAGLLQRRIERPGDAGIVHRQRRRPPFDGDLLRRPARLPVAVRDHADTRIDGDDLAHAGQRLRGRGVEALQPTAELRRAQHHRRQQARQRHVDAKPRLAGDLGRLSTRGVGLPM